MKFMVQIAASALLMFAACSSEEPMAPGTGTNPASNATTAGGVAPSPTAGAAVSGVAGAGPSAGVAGAAASGGAATFTAVLAILADPNNNCGLCHKMAMIGGGLIFDPADKAGTFAALVGPSSKGMSGNGCTGKPYVVPGQPASSLLYDKLASATPSCGARMPASGVVLTDAELATVRAWIAAGAKND